MFKIKAFSVTLIFFLAGTSWANPYIESLIASSDAQNFTLSGTGFREKEPASPILWETFEDGIYGNPLPSTGKWKPLGNSEGGSFSDVSRDYFLLSDSSYSGKLAAHNRFKVGANGPDSSFNTSFVEFDPTDEIYYCYRWRVEAKTEGDGRIIGKLGRINSNYSNPINPYHGPGNTFFSDYYPLASYWNMTMGYSTENEDVFYTMNQNINPKEFMHVNDPGVWHRHEIYKKLSTPGVDDGAIWFGVDNYQAYSDFSAMTRGPGESFQQVSVLLGMMTAGMIHSSETEVRFWIDDVYVDNTQARVELCDNRVWNLRQNCELQIPSTWTDTEIIIKINLGRLEKGKELFMFVIDEAGTVSSGYGPLISSGTSLIFPVNNLRVVNKVN